MFSSNRAPICYPVLDGGLGWLVVMAGVLSNFVSMGLYRSGGMIYIASVKTFSASRTVAAWVPMVTMMVVFFSAPIGTFLSTRFTFHRVIFLGGILGTIGMIINFTAKNIETLFIGWSFLFGMGSSLAFFPSLAIVGQCFKKKRPLANGIVLAGGAVGSVCMPPLLEHLIDTYGLNGACLIMAGLIMQFFITAAILRSVFYMTKKRIKPIKSTITQFTEVPLMDKSEIIAKEEKNQNISPGLNLSFLKNCTYLINGVANAIQASLFLATVTILPDLAVEEMGVSRIKGAYLVSATAFADVSSRVLAGICLLKLKMKKSILIILILLINVVDLLLVAFVRNYSVALFAAVLGGVCFAFGVIIYIEILASCQAPEDYPAAFGISEVIKTPLLLITASSVGSLKDATGSYKTTFIIFAAAETIAVMLWIFEYFWSRKKISKLRLNIDVIN